jgi:hypothetical protein
MNNFAFGTNLKIETTQLCARIRPPHLKHTVEFYEARTNRLLCIPFTEKKAVKGTCACSFNPEAKN